MQKLYLLIFLIISFFSGARLNTCTHVKEYLPDEWEDAPCPICGAKTSKLHERFGHKLHYTYVECLKCKNGYQSPRPKYDEKFLKAAYGTYYLFDEKA